MVETAHNYPLFIIEGDCENEFVDLKFGLFHKKAKNTGSHSELRVKPA
jgi:hypothetical protein